MTLKNPDDRIRGESTLAYAAFLCYKNDRDLNSAYNTFMQQNETALTTMKGFVKWASQYMWQKRVNEYDSWEEVFTQREIRLKGRENAFTSETIAEELYTCCMEEMRLKQGDMTHNDISRYLNICQKIGERWDKQPDGPTVNVAIDNNISQTVKTEVVSPEIAAELGRLLALKESVVVEEEEK